ncbi:MAG: hypothetical protein JSS66_06280 [Armatimonadetes bacterium]|nr:hypothetical protein [Armatimonadota bacterium]
MQLTHPYLLQQGYVVFDKTDEAHQEALRLYAASGHKEVALTSVPGRLCETYTQADEVFAEAGHYHLLEDDDDTYVDEWLEDSALPKGVMTTCYSDIASGEAHFKLSGVYAYHHGHGVVLEVRHITYLTLAED